MDGWLIGLIALVVIGVGLIAFGAFSDRRKNRRAVAEMLSPPPRTIPSMPPDAQRPRYLSTLQAHRVTDPRPALDDDQQRHLAGQLKAAGTVRIPVGFAAPEFITDTGSGRAVIDSPRLLVSAEPIMAIRELISVLEHMITDHTALVVVAPTLSSEVLDTLVVNHLQRMIDVVAVVTRDPIPVDTIVEATGATLVSRIDLQNGYVSDQHLGRCDRWVSDRKVSYVVRGPSRSTPP
ncbi:hypothetical protein GCM10011575_23200 [Microlunatus endophyticus]|uniref:Uncharacterized protein n=1 Tax=Microlunatus endophyticus TaxID=1716077 RepID=A0A917S886_9ACTN|nr:hypothetical protein [Microlunatus endophyticus]GGL64089.1 hypothetical protein GCM10011575_23200 [Microlunatus endophyticus]